MTRNQWILGGLLALQLILILLFRSPFSATQGATETTPLFPQLEAFTPAKLAIDGGEQERLTLVKDGSDWTLEEFGGFPADQQKVDELLDDLRELEVRRPVVSSGRYHETFRITDDENEGRIRIWDEPSDDPEIELILGSSPNYRMLHVRRGGETPVYEVQGLSSYDARPEGSAWIRTELVDVAQQDVVRLSLTNANGTIELELRDGVWIGVAPASLRDKPLDTSKVEPLLRAAASMRLAEPVGPIDDQAHGFADPEARIELSWVAGGIPPRTEGQEPVSTPEPEELTIRIGGKLADNETQRYVTRSGFEFTGTIWDSSVTKLLEQQAADLIAAGGGEA